MEIPTKAANQSVFSVQTVQPTRPVFATSAKILVQVYAGSKLNVLSLITFQLALANLATWEIPSTFAVCRSVEKQSLLSSILATHPLVDLTACAEQWRIRLCALAKNLSSVCHLIASLSVSWTRSVLRIELVTSTSVPILVLEPVEWVLIAEWSITIHYAVVHKELQEILSLDVISSQVITLDNLCYKIILILWKEKMLKIAQFF